MIIFDLDGTLYRTHETCLPPLCALCGKYGVAFTAEDVRSLLHTTFPAFLSKAAPDMPTERREKLALEFKHTEIETVKAKGRLFDGAEEMLASLDADGVPMMICGMGSAEYIDAVLERCDIRRYFKHICHRSGELTKPQILSAFLRDTATDPAECIFVGDSVTDMTAARDNNIAFLGAAYGYGAEDIRSAVTAADITELMAQIYRSLIFRRIERDIAHLPRPLIIGINGVDTSGKTEFALGLRRYLTDRGYRAQTVHTDDFHNPRAVRALDTSPEGYIANAFDTEALAVLLAEMKTRPVDRELTLLDLDSDTYTNRKRFVTTPETVIIVEGVLLYRPPLDGLIDYKIFLDISFDEVRRRAEARDAPRYGAAFLRKYEERYIPAQKLYLERYAPKALARLVIDNSDYYRPRVI